MKNLCLVLILTGVLTAGLYGKGRAEGEIKTLEKGVLKVGMNIAYPPMEYYGEGGAPEGFDVSLAREIGRELGLQVELVDTPWDRIFDGLKAGQYDCVISSVTVTAGREAFYDFTRPYLGSALAIVALRGLAVAGPWDLQDRKIAYQEKTTAGAYLAGLVDLGLQCTLAAEAEVGPCFEALENRQVDAVVCDSVTAVSYTEAAESPFKLAWRGPLEGGMGICVKQDNVELTRALDRALRKLFAQGVLQKLSREFFHQDLVTALQ